MMIKLVTVVQTVISQGAIRDGNICLLDEGNWKISLLSTWSRICGSTRVRVYGHWRTTWFGPDYGTADPKLLNSFFFPCQVVWLRRSEPAYLCRTQHQLGRRTLFDDATHLRGRDVYIDMWRGTSRVIKGEEQNQKTRMSMNHGLEMEFWQLEFSIWENLDIFINRLKDLKDY